MYFYNILTISINTVADELIQFFDLLTFWNYSNIGLYCHTFKIYLTTLYNILY